MPLNNLLCTQKASKARTPALPVQDSSNLLCLSAFVSSEQASPKLPQVACLTSSIIPAVGQVCAAANKATHNIQRQHLRAATAATKHWSPDITRLRSGCTPSTQVHGCIKMQWAGSVAQQAWEVCGVEWWCRQGVSYLSCAKRLCAPVQGQHQQVDGTMHHTGVADAACQQGVPAPISNGGY